MSDTRRTNFNLHAKARGLATATGVVTPGLNHGQLDELYRTADAAGCKLVVAAPAVANDVFVLAPIASQTNTITVQATVPGTGLATGIVTVQVNDNGADALVVTNAAGVVLIRLANTTDANNTLTLIKAALDLVAAGQYTATITGTASTQMVHGGTNTLAATAAGGTVGTSLKSTSAGVGTFSVTPA